MRTALFLLVGLSMLGACLVLGRLFSAHYSSAPYAATVAFILVWLGISAANLWVGVAKAGYSLAEELPIFLVIFGLPALAAVILKWKFF